MKDRKEKDGVLPAQDIRRLVGEAGLQVPRENIQPASLDLRLGQYAYRLRCSFLPMDTPVEQRLQDFQMEYLDLDRGAVLEVNRPYLIPLEETLQLPPDIHARSNPRSSTGRLDVFTRVIVDRTHQFDTIPDGYQGRMFLEVISRSYTIKLCQELSLNQIRLIRGDPEISTRELLEIHQRDPLANLDGQPLTLGPEELRGGLPMSVDLQGPDGRGRRRIVGYRAKRNSRLLDLTHPKPHAQEDFWEPIEAEAGSFGSGGRLVLEPEEFYILASRESVRIPPGLAAEMVALDPRSGEFRTHYAGFFDPGFGYNTPGTRAVMEIRAHDVPFALEHGQQVCRLKFERLLEIPEITYGAQAGSSYQGQGIRLSKHFVRRNDTG